MNCSGSFRSICTKQVNLAAIGSLRLSNRKGGALLSLLDLPEQWIRLGRMCGPRIQKCAKKWHGSQTLRGISCVNVIFFKDGLI